MTGTVIFVQDDATTVIPRADIRQVCPLTAGRIHITLVSGLGIVIEPDEPCKNTVEDMIQDLTDPSIQWDKAVGAAVAERVPVLIVWTEAGETWTRRAGAYP